MSYLLFFLQSLFRSWRYDASNESYVVIATSVSHPSATLLSGVRCTELAMRYIIETAGDNNSILTMFCRVDMRLDHILHVIICICTCLFVIF